MLFFSGHNTSIWPPACTPYVRNQDVVSKTFLAFFELGTKVDDFARNSSPVMYHSYIFPSAGRRTAFLPNKGDSYTYYCTIVSLHLPYSKSAVWSSVVVASGCYKRTEHAVRFLGRSSECPGHILLWISFKVEFHITLNLLYLRSNFGELRMHRLYKTSIVCSPIKIRTSIPIYLAVTLWHSEDVGNSELVKSQTAPRIPVYGSKV